MPSNSDRSPTGHVGQGTGSEGVARGLQDLLRSLVSRANIHHAVIAVETGDGSFRWIGAAGEAHPDGTPMREDTPICIASVTKLYIAAAVLRLHEGGLVGLDEPITTYLPSSLIGGIHRLDGVDRTAAITVRHLLGHASGLPDFLDDRPKGGQSFLDALVAEGDRSWDLDEAMRIVRDDLRPHFSPQQLDARRPKVRYSDTNYQLLMAIIEAVTGRPVHEVFDELLYARLGLRHTYHPGTREDPSPGPATMWFGERPLNIPQAMRCLRDLNSTMDDMLRFMRALVRGEVFERPATLDAMLGHWNTFGFSLNPMPTSPSWPIEYGLGAMRFSIPRLFSPFRPVPAVVGHTGVTGSWLFHCPELDVLLAGTVDQGTAAAAPFNLAPRMLRLLEGIGR